MALTYVSISFVTTLIFSSNLANGSTVASDATIKSGGTGTSINVQGPLLTFNLVVKFFSKF